MKRFKGKCVVLLGITLALIMLLFPADYVRASVDDKSVSTDEGVSEGGFRFELKADGTVKITKYLGSNMDVVIPDTIDGKLVTTIGESAFYVSDIISLSLPGSVSAIEDGGLKYCRNLVTVIFREEGLLTIGERAFEGCEKLSTITIPSTVTTIGECAFINTHKLTKINIPGNITTLGRGIFYNSAISDVEFGENIAFIGEEMFQGCSQLTSITIPSTVTDIRSSAFSHCSNLTNVTIPKAVVKIGEYAFYATNLQTIQCYQDTKGYQYAKDHNIAIKLLGPHFDKLELTLYIGEKKTLKVKNSKDISHWKSSNQKVVKVSKDGVITAVGKGKATITVMADNTNISCKITIKDLALNSKSVTVTAGKTVKLTMEGTKKTISWTTSNSKIASVSKKGVVTGKSAGTATITAKVAGKSYTCKVTVKRNEVKFTDETSMCPYGQLGVSITKVYYSGKTMVAEGYVINNTSAKVSKLRNFYVNIYNGNSIIASQTFSNYNLNLSPYMKKKVTFVINSSNVKDKTLELRSSNISTDCDGTYEYYY